MDAPAPIRAVVFDFDGVIADSEGAHERAVLETVGTLGMRFTHEQYLERIIGFDDRDAYRLIAGLNGRTLSSGDLLRLAEAKHGVFGSIVAEGGVRRFPGSIELAVSLAEHVPIAVCSGALRSEIEPILAAFNASGVFPVIVTADDVDRSKPDPAGYRMAAAGLGVPASACAAIEDTPTGIRAAKDAGYGLVVGVCHSVGRGELRAAHRIVERISDLDAADLLGGSFG